MDNCNSCSILAIVKKIVQDWLDKQGHERCWFYPELFNELARVLNITPTRLPCLPPREEFEQGCRRYQDEQYNMVWDAICNGCKKKSHLDNHRQVNILILGNMLRELPNEESIHLLCKDCINNLYKSIGVDYECK